MAKSRAQIQKEYRERKKAEGSTYLTQERRRQKRYRKKVTQMTPRELQRKREMNKLHCFTYRNKRKQTEQTNSVDTEPIPGTSATFSPHEEPMQMTVRLPFPTGKTRKARRSKALRKANSRIQFLESKIKSHQKAEQKYKKRFERLKNKTEKQHKAESSVKALTPMSGETLTSRTKTKHELRAAGVSPRRMPKSVVRKLELANVIGEEIKETVRRNPRTKQQNLVKRILAGKIVKRYRCKAVLRSVTGLDIRRLQTDKNVELVKYQRSKESRDQLRDKILEFMERDDVSRCMPGKQDSVKSGGEKKQIRILNDYLSSQHAKFIAENPNIKCCLALFCKLRPKHIKLTALISRNTCMCTSHMNMAMKLKCLKNAGLNVSVNPESVSRSLDVIEMRALVDTVADQPIEFESWKRVDCQDGKKRMKVVKTEMTRDAFIDSFMKEYVAFLGHVERVRNQYHAVAKMKANLQAGDVVAQMDFAENFTCQSQDEVQSAYWNSTAVSLHPVVVYYKADDHDEPQHKNYIFISDVLQHNARAVTAIMSMLVPRILRDLPGTTRIQYWTDSPSSQYRNRYIFDVLCRHEQLFGIKASWHFFESGHGKGPCDSLGGAAKRHASEAVRQGKTTIQDAHDFFNWAKGSEKSIRYLFYSQEEYEAAEKILNQRSVRPVPGTMKTHAVIPDGPTSLYIREVCLQ